MSEPSFLMIEGAPNPVAPFSHVVETDGWISAELHSHSSPSGDNTSRQLAVC